MWFERIFMGIGLLAALFMVACGAWLLSLGNQSLVYTDDVHLFVCISFVVIGFLSIIGFSICMACTFGAFRK